MYLLESYRIISLRKDKNNESTSLSQRWQELAREEKDLQVSGFLLSLDSGKFAQLAPREVLPAASAIKIPILLATLDMVASGELSWDEELQLNKKTSDCSTLFLKVEQFNYS